jgi:hypothetical protein
MFSDALLKMIGRTVLIPMAIVYALKFIDMALLWFGRDDYFARQYVSLTTGPCAFSGGDNDHVLAIVLF